MAYYFAFPLAADHQRQLDELIEAHSRGSYNTPEEIGRLAILGVDGVIKVLALDVIEILKNDKEGGSILDVVARLVTSTMHVLLKQLLGKVSHGEQDKLSAYMLRRRVDTPTGRLFGFQMPDAAGEMLQTALHKAAGTSAEQSLDAVRDDLIKAMLLFIDLTTEYCYDEFAACLDLGMIKRKFVDISRSTIQKAGHSTVRKLFATLSDEQIAAVSKHYDGMVLSF